MTLSLPLVLLCHARAGGAVRPASTRRCRAPSSPRTDPHRHAGLDGVAGARPAGARLSRRVGDAGAHAAAAHARRGRLPRQGARVAHAEGRGSRSSARSRPTAIASARSASRPCQACTCRRSSTSRFLPRRTPRCPERSRGEASLPADPCRPQLQRARGHGHGQRVPPGAVHQPREEGALRDQRRVDRADAAGHRGPAALQDEPAGSGGHARPGGVLRVAAAHARHRPRAAQCRRRRASR